MTTSLNIYDQYYEYLLAYLDGAGEEVLASVFELGRDLAARSDALEMTGELQYEVMRKLSETHPSLTLAEVSRPLAILQSELLVAFSVSQNATVQTGFQDPRLFQLLEDLHLGLVFVDRFDAVAWINHEARRALGWAGPSPAAPLPATSQHTGAPVLARMLAEIRSGGVMQGERLSLMPKEPRGGTSAYRLEWHQLAGGDLEGGLCISLRSCRGDTPVASLWKRYREAEAREARYRGILARSGLPFYLLDRDGGLKPALTDADSDGAVVSLNQMFAGAELRLAKRSLQRALRTGRAQFEAMISPASGEPQIHHVSIVRLDSPGLANEFLLSAVPLDIRFQREDRVVTQPRSGELFSQYMDKLLCESSFDEDVPDRVKRAFFEEIRSCKRVMRWCEERDPDSDEPVCLRDAWQTSLRWAQAYGKWKGVSVVCTPGSEIEHPHGDACFSDLLRLLFMEMVRQSEPGDELTVDIAHSTEAREITIDVKTDRPGSLTSNTFPHSAAQALLDSRGITYTYQGEEWLHIRVRGMLFSEVSQCDRRKQYVSSQRRILLVEDESSVARVMTQLLTRADYEVRMAGTLEEVRQIVEAESKPFELVLTDWELPDGTGRDVADIVRGLEASTSVILVSGRFNLEDDEELREEFPCGVLKKPFSKAELLETVSSCVARRKRFATVRDEATL